MLQKGNVYFWEIPFKCCDSIAGRTEGHKLQHELFFLEENTLQCVKHPHWCWLKPKGQFLDLQGWLGCQLLVHLDKQVPSSVPMLQHTWAGMQCITFQQSHAMVAMLSFLSSTSLQETSDITFVQMLFRKTLQILPFLLSLSAASRNYFCKLRKIPDLILITKWS